MSLFKRLVPRGMQGMKVSKCLLKSLTSAHFDPEQGNKMIYVTSLVLQTFSKRFPSAGVFQIPPVCGAFLKRPTLRAEVSSIFWSRKIEESSARRVEKAAFSVPIIVKGGPNHREKQTRGSRLGLAGSQNSLSISEISLVLTCNVPRPRKSAMKELLIHFWLKETGFENNQKWWLGKFGTGYFLIFHFPCLGDSHGSHGDSHGPLARWHV